MDTELQRQAEKLSSLPYTIEVGTDDTTDGEQAFVARVLELEGCIAQGRTIEDVTDNIHSATVDYIASLLEDGLQVPLPMPLASTSSAHTSTTLLRVYRADHAPGEQPDESRLYEASLIAA